MSGNPGTWEFEDEGFVADSDLKVGCNQIEVVEGGPGYILVINGRQINKSDIY